MSAPRSPTAALLIPLSVLLLTLTAAQRKDDPPKALPKPQELELLQRWVGTWGQTLVMMTYDPEDQVYRVWSFSSTGGTSDGTGRWAENSNTMTWNGKGRGVEGSFTSVLADHWLDENTREIKNTIKDSEGKVIADVQIKVRKIGRVGLGPIHTTAAERN